MQQPGNPKTSRSYVSTVHLKKDVEPKTPRHIAYKEISDKYASETALNLHNKAFVFSNKGVKEWYYFSRLVPNTSLTCNKLSLQLKKCVLSIKEHLTNILARKYTIGS